jgi:pullulanase/glycogen debranching enzyme
MLPWSIPGLAPSSTSCMYAVFRASQFRVNGIETTYAGLIEKSPYLQHLGVTAVELLPVFQFDPQDAPPSRTYYWGYSPVSFFAPHEAYRSRRDPLGALDEFRDMVKALHRAGIEVILDVVFNHTAEGGHDGPTQCFRGLGDPTYYLLQQDRSRYPNITGTGNTLSTNHPVVRRMIIDSLRYWSGKCTWMASASIEPPSWRGIGSRHADSPSALGH